MQSSDIKASKVVNKTVLSKNFGFLQTLKRISEKA